MEGIGSTVTVKELEKMVAPDKLQAMVNLKSVQTNDLC